MSALTFLVLAAATVGWGAVAQAQTPHRDSLLRFQRRGERWLATLNRTLLERDFLLEAQVIGGPRAAPPSPIGAKGGERISTPVLGARFTSGALRARRVGDSLMLSEYVGRVGERLRYRPLGAMPIMAVSPASEVTVDAGLLWTTLGPTGDRASFAWEAPPRWNQLADPSPLPEAPARWPAGTTVTLVVGNDTVTYAAGVLLLPKAPMRPRLADPRVGFYTNASIGRRVGSDKYILRHRLEKKDPAAPVSDVVQPIVYRLEKGFTEQLVRAIKQAGEAWGAVLESAGFRGAIKVLVADDPPSREPEREIAVSFMGGNMGGMGPCKMDPRSGEAVGCFVRVGGGTNADWRYYTLIMARHAPTEPFPLSDSLKVEMYSRLAMHEFGHTLGLKHNFRAEGYPVDSLRQPAFVRRVGFTSVMSYSPDNFVAQPEDHIPLQDLVSGLSAWDRWAIQWGYRPIPEAATPEEELPTLEWWRAAQDTAPYLRTPTGKADSLNPYRQVGLIGDDVLKAVAYGLRNMAGVAARTTPALTPALRATVRNHWTTLLSLVPEVIGGEITRDLDPRAPASIQPQPIDSAYQVQALRFILARLFYGQDDLVGRMLSQRPRGDTTVVLFTSLAPAWEASETVEALKEASKYNGDPRPMRDVQQSLLAGVVKRVRRLSISDPPAAELCRELATFERRLLVTSGDASPDVARAQVDTLARTVAGAFKGGPCRR